MSPLQKIAMGMVIVVAYAYFPAHPEPAWQHYDALANPLGWVLVLLGVHALARLDDTFDSSRWLAVVAAVVSVPMWFPQVEHRLDDSGQWFVSLPQALFCLLLARSIGILGAQQSPRDGYVAKRFGLLVWGYAVAAVLPVLALGGGLSQLDGPTQLFSTLVNVVFIYLLFRVHRREWLGGPGPVEVAPRPRAGGQQERPDEREGRPPSR
jgi:hypothetical protein